jgi:2,3-bisphosphoglycerate-dependent phosphoglycerate mutase
MAKLVLVRHGMSEYNKKGMWTGWDDPDLSPEGVENARRAGESLKDINFDYAYSADLKRAIETLDEILNTIGEIKINVSVNWELKERNYGDYTAKNKWEIKELVGDEEFQKIRRGWDHPIPNGESLKQVNERIWPFFLKEILPKVKDGKNVLISSSGNALRALLKSLENIPDDEIGNLEFGIGEAWVYEIDKEGKVTSKEIRNKNPLAGKQ